MRFNVSRVTLLLLFLPCWVTAQEVKPISAYNYATEKYEPYFYTNTYEAGSDYGSNNYLIFGKKTARDTVFIIELIYRKTRQEITIRQTNKKSGRTSDRTMAFKPLAKPPDTSSSKPIYCIRDYRCNDTSITLQLPDSTKTDILFSVADTAKGMIFLHRITTFDTLFHFSLDKFRNTYLKPHLAHAAIYWTWRRQQVQDSIKRVAENGVKLSAIQKEQNTMKADFDSLAKFVVIRQQAIPLNIFPADSVENVAFRHRMDGVLSNYLFETQPVNLQTSGEYKVLAKENQVTDVLDKPSKKTTDPLFFAYFRQPVTEIEREIGTMKLTRRKVGVNADSGFREIVSRHKTRCGRSGLDVSLFTIFIDSLNQAAAPFRKQTEVSTIYSYRFTYSSSSSWNVWSKRGNHFKDQRTRDSVDNKALLDEFNNKIKKAKNGKYKLRVNSSKLNDSIFGPHIDTVYRKYKYLSHVGFSVGNFLTGKEYSTKNETVDGSLVFFDVFLIYHHYGLFGGFASKSVFEKTKIDGYFEGGVYLAPGNYFFFKLGVAKANNEINGIAGASLIFPFFQLEAGYNFALRNAFVMLGFNVPFNQ